MEIGKILNHKIGGSSNYKIYFILINSFILL